MNELTKKLAQAVESAKAWPADQQNAAADLLDKLGRLAEHPYEPSDEELAEIEAGLAEARRGEFASDAEVAALFARYGL